MLNSIILFLLLFGTWLVFSGFFDPFFIGLGVFSSALAIVISIRSRPEGYVHRSAFGLALRSFGYMFWLLKEVLKSSIDVTIKMWQLEPEIDPEINWISTNLQDDVCLTIYGNSITLTPGTVTSDVRGEGLVQVHALNKEGLEDLRRGAMSGRVANLVGSMVVAEQK